MADSEHVKVVMVTGTGDNARVETPWAVPLGGSRFRLDNVLFYAYGVSLDDVIEATPEPDDARPHFRHVVEKSGNRTVRVIADDGKARVPAHVLEELVGLGCGYEGANPRYICVNIPSRVDLDVVVTLLKESKLRWEHADPTYEQLHRG